MTYWDSQGSAAAKENTKYTYNEVGNLIAQTTTGSHDLSLKYAYDRSGRMVSESRTENGTTLDSAFTYDPLGQLTGFTRSDGISEQYSYDAVGNMTQKVKGDVTTTMTYNAANQLTKSVTGGNTTTYAYDHNGNLTEKQTATGTTRYTYNALNLLQSYTGEDGYTERYTYNADRLLSSITTPDSTTTLTWDLLHGDGVVISETTGKKTTDFTYGLERISAQTGSNRTEYVYDGRGSVAAEVSYNNAWYTFGGTLAWKHVTSKSYTPFGEQIGEKTSGFGYNGEYYNAATGMIYLRARFYEPEMNRFSQKDLLKGEIISGTSLNRYVYCWNDPVNYVDRNGQIPTYNVSVTDSGGGSYHWNQTRRNQTPKTPVKPRSSGVSHPAQSNLQKTQKMLEEIHDQNPFIKSDSKKLFKDYTGIDVDQTDKAPYKSWDGNRRNSSDKAESYVTRNNGRTDRIDTAKPSVKPISGTQAPCSLWESMQQGQKQQRQVERIRKAANSDLLLRLMTNSSIGINVGFGLSGGGDVTFVADKNGDVYALIAVGAGGGLGLDMKGGPSFNSIGTGLDPDNVLKDIDLVDSIDERSGWGISVGGTATIISAELRSTEPNEMNSNFGITTSYGYDFHAHIIYSWAVKVGSIVEED